MTLPRDSEGPRSYRHVSSSTVAAITYERSTRTLGIRFQRGAEYRYFSVPETVYLESPCALRIPKGDTSTLGYEMLGIRFSGYTRFLERPGSLQLSQVQVLIVVSSLP